MLSAMISFSCLSSLVAGVAALGFRLATAAPPHARHAFEKGPFLCMMLDMLRITTRLLLLNVVCHVRADVLVNV